MPVIEYQGQLHEFPDTFTDAQIGRALKGHSLRGEQAAARSELLPKLAGFMPAPDAPTPPSPPAGLYRDMEQGYQVPTSGLPRVPRITAQDAARAFDVLGAAAEFGRQGAFNPTASTEFDERMARDVTPGIPSKIAAGVQQTAAGLAEPEAIALMAATAGLGALPVLAQRAASAGFAGWMAHNAGQQAADLEQALKDDDVEAAARATAGLGMDTLFAGLSAKHSLQGIAKNSPRIAGWLSQKVAVENIPPAELKASYHRLERGMGTEADANLVRMVNESSTRPGQAFRQGVTVEESSPRVGPAFRDWLGAPEVTGARTVRLRDGREVAADNSQLSTLNSQPPPGPRGLLRDVESAAPVLSEVAPSVSPALRARKQSDLELRIQDAEAALWSLSGLQPNFLPALRATAARANLSEEQYLTQLEEAREKLTRGTAVDVQEAPDATLHLPSPPETVPTEASPPSTAAPAPAGPSQPTLEQAINAGLAPRTGKQVRVQFAGVSPEAAMRIEDESGAIAKDAYHVMDDDFVRKVLKDHGDPATEAARGNEAVTPEDFSRLPQIVSEFDAVERGEKLGTAGLVFIKRFNGTTYYVATGPNKNGRLLSKTMWKKPTRPQSVAPVAPPPTSETLPGKSASSEEAIRPEAAPVKPAAVRAAEPGLSKQESAELNALEQQRRAGALDAAGGARYRALEARAGQWDLLAQQPKPAVLPVVEAAKPDPAARGFYKEPSGKTVIVMPKAEYDGLPEATHSKIVRYFNWSPRRKAFISKASKDDYWARQISREVKLEEMDAREAPEPVAEAPAVAAANDSAKAADRAFEWKPPATDKQGLERDREEMAATETELQKLQAEWQHLHALNVVLAEKVINSRGKSWERGNIKASAKKSDVEGYNAQKEAMAKLDRAMNDLRQRVRPAAQRVRVAELNAIASDPAEPPVRQVGAAVGALYEAGQDVPEQAQRALEQVSREEIRQRIPDVQETELQKMAHFLSSDMMNGRVSVDDSFKNNAGLDVQKLRREELASALTEITARLQESDLPPELVQTLNEVVPGWYDVRYQGQTTKGKFPLKAGDVAALADEMNRAVKTKQAADAAAAEAATAQRVAAAEAENAEDATVRQMMADAADEMAKAGTKRSAAEIKKELVARLEAALKAAPVEVGADGAKRRVMIGVPGDGVFALVNTKAVLQEILTRAKAMSTATGVADTGKARGTPVPAVNKKPLTPAEVVKQLEEFEHPDDARGSLQQVYSEAGRALVSDGRTMIEVKGPFPAKNDVDQPFPVALADGIAAKALAGADQQAKVSTEDLFRIGRLRMGLEWGDLDPWVDLFEGKDGQIYAESKDKQQNIAGYGRPTTDRYLGRYNAEALEKLARFARKMGNESVTLTPSAWMEKQAPSAIKDGQKKEPLKDIKKAAGILQGTGWRAVTMRFNNEATVPAPEETKVGETGRGSASASASPMPAGRPAVGSPPPVAGPPPLPHEDPSFSGFPLGMPELVDLYRSLSAGQLPKVVQAIARLPWAAGVFRHNDATGVARVELLAKLFKLLTPEEEAALLAQAREYAQTVAQPGDNLADLVRERYQMLLKQALEEAKRRGPVRAQQVLAHEIMHWIDWVPDHTLKRGNILGHIAAFKDSWLKHWLARDPSQPHGKPLTPAEKEKLRAQALKQMQAELGPMREIVRTILVEEPVWEIAGVKPEDVKNLFGLNAREELPELYRWFAEQPATVKKEVVKAAMKGLVDERLAALGTKKQVGTQTIERTVRERVGREPTPEEVAAKFRILLRAEILKRNLVELETIKRELEAAIAWYQGTPTMNPYFKTGIEMFAEAGSIWLNNPFALAQRAPTFHAALTHWLGHRPEVKKLYDQIQEDLRTGAHQDKRRQRLREMFKRGDEKGMERRRNSMDKPQFLDGVRYELDRVFGPVYRRSKGTAMEGSVYQAVGNFRYRAAEQELFLSRENNEVGRLLAENALDWADFGELLTYRRIIDERFDLANPLGITPKDALEGIERLKATLGPARYGKLVEAAERFNGIWQEMVVKPLVETGYVSPELADKMQGNTVYATFSVQRAQSEEGINRLLDMAFGAGIGPKIYRQMGTLQEIKNPATAAMMKGLSLISAVHRNTAKREVMKLMQEVDPELIREADQHWNGKRHEWVMKDTPHVGTVVVMNGGQPTAYYVPRTIAEALNGADPMESQLAIAAIKANNTLKALYTQLNYGFWPVNLMRDTGSFWLQMPGAMSPVRWAKNLPRAWRAAVSSERGTPNADAKEALRRLMVISRAEYRGLEAADEHEFTLESFGQTPADWDRTAKQHHLLLRAWLKYKGLGQTFERLNKINGMLYMDEYFPSKPEWQKQKIVRELAGSPDFLERSGSAAVNWALMFYNPWKEGLHSLKAAAKADPWGFSFKTFGLVMLPAVLQALAASGLFGDERKKQYRSIPDYDLSNYWCVPLGWQDEAQGKVAYMRLPLAEPMRVMNGVIFHTLTARGQGLTEYGAGQLPGLNSFAKVAMAWAALAAGQNPHDTFRGKDVVDKDTFEAGGIGVAGSMGKWTWNELGGGIVHRFADPQLTDPPKENIEQFLQAPVVSNLLGRWVKVSSRGIDDADRKLAEPVRQQRAQARVAVREMIRKFESKEPWAPEEHALINKDAYAAQYLSETLAKVLAQRESLLLRRWEKRESNAERGAVFAPQQ